MSDRFDDNPNLTLVYGNSYRELPILELYTPMIKQYLDKTYDVLYRALADHGRITAFKVDLHYQANKPLPKCAYGNEPITDFINSVKSQIAHDRKRSAKKFDRVNHTAFHYIWCREIGDTGRPHYHAFILVNAGAYDTLGDWINGRKNMAYRFFHAWARAIDLDIETAKYLVQFPENPPYHVVSRNDPQAIGLLYQHMSYLSKAYSKHYNDWVHCFDCSRKSHTERLEAPEAPSLSPLTVE